MSVTVACLLLLMPRPMGGIAPPKVEAVNQNYSGFVTAVGPDHLVVEQNRDGKTIEFSVSATLAKGGFDMDQTPGDSYRLKDVKVGDKVSVLYSRIDGVNVCEAIGIRRRPGGLIPPSNGPSDQKIPYHQRMQAWQDFEEKGTPLPAYLRPLPWGRDIAPPPREKFVRPIPRPADYVGEVLAVSKNSITIRGRDTCDHESPDVIRNFKAGSHLAKGEQDPFEASGFDYRLSDAKVGDKVLTKLREAGDDDLCIQIRIQRRPKGLVPPAPFESADNPHKYHNDMNAYQAHEERGVPLPLRLNPDFQRYLSDLRNHEYMLYRKEKDRTAPPPRPVFPK